MTKSAIERDINAYEKMLSELLEHHEGKYVVFKDGEFVDAFDNFQNAASAAVEMFGLGPYLIRQVLKQQEVTPLPASVAFRPIYATC